MTAQIPPSKNFQNISSNILSEQKISKFVYTSPEYCNRWVSDTTESEVFIQVVHSSHVEIGKRVLRALWIQLRLSLVLHYLYHKRDQIPVNTDLRGKKTEQHVLCCLLWSHCLMKGTYCGWTSKMHQHCQKTEIRGQIIKFVNRNLSMVWWHWHIRISQLCCCWSMAVSSEWRLLLSECVLVCRHENVEISC
jgi:hypothetical protein